MNIKKLTITLGIMLTTGMQASLVEENPTLTTQTTGAHGTQSKLPGNREALNTIKKGFKAGVGIVGVAGVAATLLALAYRFRKQIMEGLNRAKDVTTQRFFKKQLKAVDEHIQDLKIAQAQEKISPA